MAMFIGSNDKETLLGVVEEIERVIRREDATERRATTVKGRERAVYARATLQELHNTISMAAQNGPTPDLSKLRARMATPDLERLLADEIRALETRTGASSCIIEDSSDPTMPMTYRYGIDGTRPEKKYIDRVTAMMALSDALGSIATEKNV